MDFKSRTLPISKIILFAIVVSTALFLSYVFTFIVWLPDVVSRRTVVVWHWQSSKAGQLKVVQFWNHGDFYTTQLVHIAPDGSKMVRTLDADDSKEWSCSALILRDDSELVIHLRGPDKIFVYQWNLRRFLVD